MRARRASRCSAWCRASRVPVEVGPAFGLHPFGGLGHRLRAELGDEPTEARPAPRRARRGRRDRRGTSRSTGARRCRGSAIPGSTPLWRTTGRVLSRRPSARATERSSTSLPHVGSARRRRELQQRAARPRFARFAVGRERRVVAAPQEHARVVARAGRPSRAPGGTPGGGHRVRSPTAAGGPATRAGRARRRRRRAPAGRRARARARSRGSLPARARGRAGSRRRSRRRAPCASARGSRP